MDIDDVYAKATKSAKKDGFYEIKCRLGLWSVMAPTKKQADDLARHYFIQYFHDGEYKGFQQ